MKDLVESQSKSQYDKGNRPPKRYIVTEASVRLQTPDGVCRFPAGTMFIALSFIPVNEERKVPPGTKVGRHLATEEAPLSSTVSVAWPETAEKAILWESEPSLRQKIAAAEARAAMMRAVAVGAAAGTAVAILQRALPTIADAISHWSAVIMGLVAGVVHVNFDA